ncbi:uncharacterized protein LOC129247249 [Anastrepha obliqua]|uniref:uncharacterized protein LOC129247249 n=1 Tax=Anastrepha obliqua TaxID=95512 RepID=UPI0024099549|nr:uncharacterized protein LOC129247249 [Anastrepha obliqua]
MSTVVGFEPQLFKFQSRTSPFGDKDFIAGLKDVSVTIPQAVKRGSNALLICNYDMENDTLYSVKWYKGRREFYRYTPKENPAMKVFPMAAGLNVERNLSNQSHVVLLAVPLNISGKFTCEISVEAPTFQTAMVSGELEVVELPEEQAIVTGIQPRYRIGDLVDGNCSIKYSKPAANLTWTINGIVVPLHHIKTYQIERYEESNLESVVSALHFMVTTQHFIKGQMRLKCTASIFDIFKEEIESVIEEDRPRIMASGRSYDMHNNYPYEQHASGDGFEDHNESFLTYSAADITSSAATVHHTTAHIYAKALKMHWKYIWTGLMATAAAIQASSSQQKQPVMEQDLQRHRYIKWISEASNGKEEEEEQEEEEGEGIAATAMKNVAALELFCVGESVAYIFAAICASIFVCALTRHFISHQRQPNKLVRAEAGQAMKLREASSIVAPPLATFTVTVLLSKVIDAAAAAAAATYDAKGGAVTSPTTKSPATTVLVKRTLKGQKSYHNCVTKNLNSLSVRLWGFPRTLLMVAANPLQKLRVLKQQQTQKKQYEQRESTAILHNEARFRGNANQQLSLALAGRSPSPPSAIIFNELAFGGSDVSAAMHGAIGVCHTIGTYSCSSRGGGSNNQPIANFAKDASKDLTLLMMIAQRFDCQHVDDFVTVSPGVRQKLQQQQQQQQQLRKVQLQSIENHKVLAKAKALPFNWQGNCAPPRPCWSEC